MMADNKMLISKIKAAHDQSNQKWLYIKDMDIGDKRASLGLLIYGIYPFLDCFKIKIHEISEMCQNYDSMGFEDKFEIECAPNLGRNVMFARKAILEMESTFNYSIFQCQ